MHSLKLSTSKSHRFFTSSSKIPSVVPWVSPYVRAKSPRPDPPTEPSGIMTEVPKKPKYISHESAIKLIKREKDPHRVLRLFNMVGNQRGFNHNHSTYAVTLQKLARYRKFEDVDSVLHQMVYETCKFHESIFLDLMTHFSKSSLHKRVVEMFNAIQPIVREKPSLKAISTCLNLLVESNQADLARTFLLHTKKTLDLYPNTCIFNILVKHHCKHGNVESAFEVVKEMKLSEVSYPNLITYSTLMEGLCKKGRLEDAVNLFEEMVSKDKILPDALTYNILINGFCCGGKVDRAVKIMDFMRKNGCNPNIFNYSTLMNGFCKEGNVQEAKRVFNEMIGAGLHPDKVGFTTLINCLCRAGKVDEAMEFLKEMEKQNCKGDTITFNIILVGLCKEDRTYEALEMLERLPYEGVYLDKSSYRIVLNSLCKLGDLQKTTELLGVMLSRGFVPHFATSNELLVSLCEAGMAADADMVLMGLVQMRFNPEPRVWSYLIEIMCRERRLLATFELLDVLTNEI
ncbi:pentatricopeptide repeat-containing protein At5g18475 [Cynara cardunculus var. scolymus]|uniref:pentatricopeptide repeat-containing protein At5g18475 n=1 Tax=Cynara cardunculus var. scolymus TaxID=59895 RepID=UPI000D62960A|nr:pentatricopeptide repeat-containing protein At5g18475 [Cynara cardunculus var. scolymus]